MSFSLSLDMFHRFGINHINSLLLSIFYKKKTHTHTSIKKLNDKMSLGSSELSNFLSALGHKWITQNGWNLWFIVIESLVYLSAFFYIVNWHTSCLNILYVSWKGFPNVLVLSPVIYKEKNKTQSLFSLRCEMWYKKETFIIEWINTCSKLPQSTFKRKKKASSKWAT